MEAYLRAILLLLLSIGCGEEPKDDAAASNSKCPRIGMDTLEGRWVRVAGSAGDTTSRFEIHRDDQGYTGWFILGNFERIATRGVARTSDVAFTQVLNASEEKLYTAGKLQKRRIYVMPRQKSCSLKVTQVKVGMSVGAEQEMSMRSREEYLPFPEGQPFAFRPCDEHLYIGKAALKRSIANWQKGTHNAPERSHKLGKKIPLAAWTDAASDGDASCTFDMDLWFDDRPMKDHQAVPAGKVKKGTRHWLIQEWYAPYSGNHHFQAYRYKTCNGKRELIAVNCLDAMLHP